jgi:hypothetical protein
MTELIVAAYGAGTNSTAYLIECAKRNVKVDLILFSDTGGEKPHTYKYIKTFNAWLKDNNMPEITVIKNMQPSKEMGLYNMCIKHKTLPSIAYGFKSCSVQFKIEPVDKWLKDNFPEFWKSNNIIKLIGYDADETQRAKESPNPHYANRFDLIDWDMGRDECIKTIKDAGLPLPGKSACFFCPSSKPHEIRELARIYPKLAEKAIAMEENAELTKVIGLGRSYSWKNLLATSDMFDSEIVSNIDMACGCYDG